MTLAEAADARSLRVQYLLLQTLACRGPQTARDLTVVIRRRVRNRLGVQGYGVAGHLRELARDGLVELVEDCRVPARWQLVAERCAGVVGFGGSSELQSWQREEWGLEEP